MQLDETRFYYLREPVIWLGHRVLYRLTGDPVSVFLITDAILLLVVFAAFKNFRLPQYAFLAFLVFFPTIMGMNNIYRQWASACFLLYAMSVAPRSSLAAVGAIILAVATHNASAVFAPVVFFGHASAFRPIIASVAAVFVPSALFFLGHTKSGTTTAGDTQAIYILAVAAASAFVLGAHPDALRRDARVEMLVTGYLFLVTVCSVIFLEQSAAERMGLFSLTMLFPYIIRTAENIQPALVLRLAIAVLGFVPILIFGTRHWLV